MLHGLMRLGACLVLAAGLSGAHAASLTPNESALYEAAKKEGEITWYIGQFATDVANQFGKNFTERYPGVKVNVYRATGQVVFQRLSQDMKAGVRQCDVFSSTDIGHSVYLKAQGQYLHYVPENATGLFPAFQKIDPDGFYHTTQVNTVTILYNTDKVKPEEAPRKWTDLLDPKWKNKISLGHPGFSGTAGTWVLMMRELYGASYMEKLAKNNPQAGRSLNDTITTLNAAARVVAAGPTATALRSIVKGNPMAIVYPEDGAVLQISVSGIIKDAPHPHAAKLFMEYLLSREHSVALAETYYELLRPDVDPAPGARPMSEFKIVQPSIEAIVKGIPEIKELWRDTIGN